MNRRDSMTKINNTQSKKPITVFQVKSKRDPYKEKVKGSWSLRNILTRIFLLLWSFAVIFPLIWAFYSSFKTNQEFYANPWALPGSLNFEGYYTAWVTTKFSAYFLNSLYVVGGSVILSTLLITTSAYAIAKYQFKFVKWMRNYYMAAMMIPSVLILIPMFFLCVRLGLTNSLTGLILIYSLSAIPFSTYILVGFIKNIDNAFIEAAVIDGCNEFMIFGKIILPMAKSGILIVMMLNLLNFWNEYVTALTFITDDEKLTVPVGISFMSSAMQYRTDFGALFAGLIIGMVPMIIVYAFFQRQLQEGMALNSGLKG